MFVAEVLFLKAQVTEQYIAPGILVVNGEVQALLPVSTRRGARGQGDVHAVGGRQVGAVVLSVFAHYVKDDDVHAFNFGVGRATGLYELSS